MISVCMATFNGERFIRQQLESILSQLGESDEVIVSDDSSTDSTLSIVRKFDDSRIRIFPGNAFHSPIFNLENALRKAKGDILFLADQDDVWERDKVEIVSRHLENADLVVSDATLIDENGNLLAKSLYAANSTRTGKWYNWAHNGYVGCCMAFSGRLKAACLPFPKRIPMHDIYIGNVAAFGGFRVRFIQDKLIRYRRTPQSASPTAGKSRRSLKEKIAGRLLTLYYVWKRNAAPAKAESG